MMHNMIHNTQKKLIYTIWIHNLVISGYRCFKKSIIILWLLCLNDGLNLKCNIKNALISYISGPKQLTDECDNFLLR